MRLVARQIQVRYGQRLALAGVDLEIGSGEIVGIIGPNGSGKSTLVRSLAGVITPTGGEVSLDGQDLSLISRQERGRRIALVPQATELAFPLKVKDLVLLGRAPYTGPFGFEARRDHEAAERAMGLVGVGELEGRLVGTLSGGERQRVAVARALAQEPRLLLLDEPTSSLDLRHAVELCDLVRDLVRDTHLGVGIVLHDLNLAGMFCDRLALLSEGRLHGSGKPEEVLRYADLCQVYGTDLYVAPNDVTGKIVVLPLAREHRRQGRSGSL